MAQQIGVDIPIHVVFTTDGVETLALAPGPALGTFYGPDGNSFVPTNAAVTALTGRYQYTLAAADTTAHGAGLYQLVFTCADPDIDDATVYCTLDVGAAWIERLDAAMSSRLATAGYTAPDNANIAAIVTDTNELQTDWADGGRLDLILDARANQTSVNTIDGIVDAILLDTSTDGVIVATNNDKTGYALSAAGISAIWANASRTLSDISAALCNKIADHVHRRNNANIEASSDGDTLDLQSPYGATAVLTNKASTSGTTLTITKADLSTPLGTQTLTLTPGATPISGVETD